MTEKSATPPETRGTHYLPVTARDEKGRAALLEMTRTGAFGHRDIVIFPEPGKGPDIFLVETTPGRAWPSMRDLWQADLAAHDGKGIPHALIAASLIKITEHHPLPAGHRLAPKPAAQWIPARVEVNKESPRGHIGAGLLRSLAGLARRAPRHAPSRS